MPGREFSIGGYRYGFNGKENDNEVKGKGSQQDYGMRIYDPRLGKFLSVDPITKEYPELTPYQFASDEPLKNIDVDGLEGAAANTPLTQKQVNTTNSSVKTPSYQSNSDNQIGPTSNVQQPTVANMANLTGSNQQQANQVVESVLNNLEYELSDPRSQLNTTGTVPISNLIANPGTPTVLNNAATRAEVNNIYTGNKPMSVGLYLPTLTGNETVSNITMRNSTTQANNGDGTRTITSTTSLDVALFDATTGVRSNLSLTKMSTTTVPNANVAAATIQTTRQSQKLENMGAALFNHSMILKDRILYWEGRTNPAGGRYTNNGANPMPGQVGNPGTRVTWSGASDGDFTR